jgi:hypothetical protein
MSKSNIDRYDDSLGGVLQWGEQGCHCFFKKQLLETKTINAAYVRKERLRNYKQIKTVEDQREFRKVRDWKRAYATAKWYSALLQEVREERMILGRTGGVMRRGSEQSTVWKRYNNKLRTAHILVGPFKRTLPEGANPMDRELFKQMKQCYKKKRRLINVMKEKQTAGIRNNTMAL